MPGVIMVGNGGHARACVDAWTRDPALAIDGCVGMEAADALDVPYLGSDEALPDLFEAGYRRAFVAIGDADVRRDLSARCASIGFELVTSIAPTAQVAPTARIGSGVVVLHGAIVGAAARLGDGVIVNTGASVDHDCTIGDYSHVAPGVSMAGTVAVGAGSLIGVGACVIPGIVIGERATVGAGAVVVRDVAAGSTVVSMAAREVGG